MPLSKVIRVTQGPGKKQSVCRSSGPPSRAAQPFVNQSAESAQLQGPQPWWPWLGALETLSPTRGRILKDWLSLESEPGLFLLASLLLTVLMACGSWAERAGLAPASCSQAPLLQERTVGRLV